MASKSWTISSLNLALVSGGSRGVAGDSLGLLIQQSLQAAVQHARQISFSAPAARRTATLHVAPDLAHLFSIMLT